FVVVCVNVFVVLSVNTNVNNGDKHGEVKWGRAPGAIAAGGVALTLVQATKCLDFRSATDEYRTVQIAKSDARIKFKGPLHFENCSEDVDEGQEGYDWSDDQMTRLRTFRDTTRATAALEH